MAAISLEAGNAIQCINVAAENVTFEGRQALRLSDAAPANAGDNGRLAIFPIDNFRDGIIEIDIAGEPGPGAAQAARGFVGVAFRVAPKAESFECFYIRPTNGRADDQVRRNHSTQYISYPGYPWELLREKFPKKYECYADLEPAKLTSIKIDVRGDKAKLYVHRASQPTLIVNDLKQAPREGSIALWLGPGTIGHFVDLTVSD
ncbi:MAG: hypothetical protein ACKVQK_21520 [Burkholderiales bacterium]